MGMPSALPLSTYSLAEVIERLTIDGDEVPVIEDVEDLDAIAGRRKQMLSNAFGGVAVQFYDEAGELQDAPTISTILGRPVKPLARVLLSCQVSEARRPKAQFTGDVFVTDTGVFAVTDSENDRNEGLSDADKRCGEFAVSLGLGRPWAESLFEGQSSTGVVSELGVSEIERLQTTLVDYLRASIDPPKIV